jgi:hypothetical protein
MKASQFVIFFSVVFTIYFLGNLYIFFKGYNIIPRTCRLTYLLVYITLALTFIAAKILESRHSTIFSDVLNITGGFWLAFVLYGFLLFFLSDILYLILRLTGAINNENITGYRKWAFIITVAISSLLIIGGFINAIRPVLQNIISVLIRMQITIKTSGLPQSQIFIWEVSSGKEA